MQRAAKSFFFSFFQVLHFGLGTVSSSCFLLLYKARHQSSSRAGPLMSEPSLPLPLGEASLLRIKRGVKLRWSPGLPCPTCSPGSTLTETEGSWRRVQGPSRPDQDPCDRAQRGHRGPEKARGYPRPHSDLVKRSLAGGADTGGRDSDWVGGDQRPLGCWSLSFPLCFLDAFWY